MFTCVRDTIIPLHSLPETGYALCSGFGKFETRFPFPIKQENIFEWICVGWECSGCPLGTGVLRGFKESLPAHGFWVRLEFSQSTGLKFTFESTFLTDGAWPIVFLPAKVSSASSDPRKKTWRILSKTWRILSNQYLTWERILKKKQRNKNFIKNITIVFSLDNLMLIWTNRSGETTWSK